MCGRYTLITDATDLATAFDVVIPSGLSPRCNIAPGQPIPIIHRTATDPRRHWTLARWGLVPPWAADPATASRLINARSETAADKPAFRAAMRHRRCLLPADGFYEWRRTADGRQPHHIHLIGHQPFAIAGLYEPSHDPDGNPPVTATVLTTAANPLVAALHDRMPVILPAQHHDHWLDPAADIAGLMPLLRPYPAGQMTHHPVSTRVNNPRHDDLRCMAPVAPKPPGLFDQHHTTGPDD